MSMKSIRTQKKLVQDAIAIIKLNGNLTLRELSITEDFNVAAVSYYFGDKDRFNRAIIDKVYDELFRWIKATEVTSNDNIPDDIASLIADILVKFIRENKGIVKYILGLKLDKKFDEDITLHAILTGKHNEMFAMIERYLQRLLPWESRQELLLRFTMCYSGLLIPIVYEKGDNAETIVEKDESYIQMVRMFLMAQR